MTTRPTNEVDELRAALARYDGYEERLRARIAQDVNRARRPEFPAGERPDLIVATTRAIDIRLIEDGPYAPYWVPKTNGAPTPCSVPECDVDGTGEPCSRHEREHAHAEGEHELCGPECPALRQGALDSATLRRAATKLTELRARLKTQGDPGYGGVSAALRLVKVLADAAEAGEEW